MKKLNLQLGSIKAMLTKEEMKKVAGGYDDPTCCPVWCGWANPLDFQDEHWYHCTLDSCYPGDWVSDCYLEAYYNGVPSNAVCSVRPC